MTGTERFTKANYNHAKIGHRLFHGQSLSIFGDMNQEARGQAFQMLNVRFAGMHVGARFSLDEELYNCLTRLLDGDNALTR